MNNHTSINLEMQVQNHFNWEDRSLSYLCRSYDQLHQGEDYSEIGPAIHIGFLDFTPFPDFPEFYATYKLMNEKNHHLYSSKFSLGVVDLTKIELATEDDKAWQINHWARLFKATTWEELKMIAQKNEAMQEASETLYSMHCEETVRGMARAREDQIRLENTYKKMIQEREAALADQLRLENTYKKIISEKDAEIADKIRLEDSYKKTISEKDAEIADKIRLEDSYKKTISEKDAEIAKLQALVEQLKN